MKTSTEIFSASVLVGEHKATELIAKAGFDAWDFSMFDMCSYDRARRSSSGRFPTGWLKCLPASSGWPRCLKAKPEQQKPCAACLT